MLFLLLYLSRKQMSTNIIKIEAKQEPVPGSWSGSSFLAEIKKPNHIEIRRFFRDVWMLLCFLKNLFFTVKIYPTRVLMGSSFYIDDCVISRFVSLIFKTSNQNHGKTLFRTFCMVSQDNKAMQLRGPVLMWISVHLFAWFPSYHCASHLDGQMSKNSIIKNSSLVSGHLAHNSPHFIYIYTFCLYMQKNYIS